MHLYEQTILRHYHAPLNHGRLKKRDEVFEGANPLCGDEIIIDVRLDRRKKIRAVGWEGRGCAISQAAASIFSEEIRGKTISQVRKIKGADFLQKLRAKLSPTRMKCALLPLYAIKGEK